MYAKIKQCRLQFVLFGVTLFRNTIRIIAKRFWTNRGVVGDSVKLKKDTKIRPLLLVLFFVKTYNIANWYLQYAHCMTRKKITCTGSIHW